MEAYTQWLSTHNVDALVEALGGASGVSKSEVGRICQGLDEQVKAFLGRPSGPEHSGGFTSRGGRDRQNALVYREVLGIAVGNSEAEGFWRHFLGSH